MKQFNKILLAISLLTLSGIASAVAITGSIEFDGGYTTDNGDKDTATVFTFLNPIDVTAASGSFAALSGQTVTYNPLDLGSIPISPLWSTTVSLVDYSFVLNAIVDDVITSFGGSTTRTIYGTGDFTIGTDTQWGDWLFTTQGGGSGGTFSFSASQVPEPGIALLLGVGLIGFGVARKLRK